MPTHKTGSFQFDSSKRSIIDFHQLVTRLMSIGNCNQYTYIIYLVSNLKCLAFKQTFRQLQIAFPIYSFSYS